jgi:hypothetical protein
VGNVRVDKVVVKHQVFMACGQSDYVGGGEEMATAIIAIIRDHRTLILFAWGVSKRRVD